jgi:hypothetical protein
MDNIKPLMANIQPLSYPNHLVKLRKITRYIKYSTTVNGPKIKGFASYFREGGKIGSGKRMQADGYQKGEQGMGRDEPGDERQDIGVAGAASAGDIITSIEKRICSSQHVGNPNNNSSAYPEHTRFITQRTKQA